MSEKSGVDSDQSKLPLDQSKFSSLSSLELSYNYSQTSENQVSDPQENQNSKAQVIGEDNQCEESKRSQNPINPFLDEQNPSSQSFNQSLGQSVIENVINSHSSNSLLQSQQPQQARRQEQSNQIFHRDQQTNQNKQKKKQKVQKWDPRNLPPKKFSKFVKKRIGEQKQQSSVNPLQQPNSNINGTQNVTSSPKNLTQQSKHVTNNQAVIQYFEASKVSQHVSQTTSQPSFELQSIIIDQKQRKQIKLQSQNSRTQKQNEYSDVLHQDPSQLNDSDDDLIQWVNHFDQNNFKNNDDDIEKSIKKIKSLLPKNSIDPEKRLKEVPRNLYTKFGLQEDYTWKKHYTLNLYPKLLQQTLKTVNNNNYSLKQQKIKAQKANYQNNHPQNRILNSQNNINYQEQANNQETTLPSQQQMNEYQKEMGRQKYKNIRNQLKKDLKKQYKQQNSKKNQEIKQQKKFLLPHLEEYFKLKWSGLVYLVLQECSINDQLIKLFVDNFENFQDLRMLNLAHNFITQTGLKLLIQNLNKFPHLKSIDFQDNEFFDEGLISFTHQSQNLKFLRKVNFSSNKITPRGFNQFCKNAKNYSEIIKLNFMTNNIKDQGLICFTNHLNVFVRLTFINLQSNSITDQGFIYFCQQFKLLSFLRRMRFDQNKITSKGFNVFIKHSNLLQKIEHISFAQNQIQQLREQDMKSLLALKYFKNLNLKNNPLKQKDKIFTAYSTLVISHQNFFEKKNLINHLEQRKFQSQVFSILMDLKFIELNLSGKNITDQKAIKILGCVKKGIIEKINLSSNVLTDNFFDFFIQYSRQFSSLTQLNLTSNKICSIKSQDLLTLQQNICLRKKRNLAHQTIKLTQNPINFKSKEQIIRYTKQTKKNNLKLIIKESEQSIVQDDYSDRVNSKQIEKIEGMKNPQQQLQKKFFQLKKILQDSQILKKDQKRYIKILKAIKEIWSQNILERQDITKCINFCFQSVKNHHTNRYNFYIIPIILEIVKKKSLEIIFTPKQFTFYELKQQLQKFFEQLQQIKQQLKSQSKLQIFNNQQLAQRTFFQLFVYILENNQLHDLQSQIEKIGQNQFNKLSQLNCFPSGGFISESQYRQISLIKVTNDSKTLFFKKYFNVQDLKKLVKQYSLIKKKVHCDFAYLDISQKKQFLDIINIKGNLSTKILMKQPWNRLKKVTLKKCLIDDEKFKPIAYNISSFTSLDFLDISQNQISSKYFKAFCQNLKPIQHFEEIDLSENRIGDQGLMLIGSIKWPRLRKINLSSNSVTDEGFSCFCQKNPKLQSFLQLRFAENQITSKSLKIFAKRISQFKEFSVKVLDFSHNRLDDQALESLSGSFHRFKYLENLYLSDNFLTQLSFITKNISKLTNLEKLYLKKNLIQEIGPQDFEAFYSIQALESVNISDNRIKNLDRDCLASTISRKIHFIKRFIKNPEPKKEGKDKMKENESKSSRKRLTISLFDNEIPLENVESLNEIIAQHPQINISLRLVKNEEKFQEQKSKKVKENVEKNILKCMKNGLDHVIYLKRGKSRTYIQTLQRMFDLLRIQLIIGNTTVNELNSLFASSIEKIVQTNKQSTLSEEKDVKKISQMLLEWISKLLQRWNDQIYVRKQQPSEIQRDQIISFLQVTNRIEKQNNTLI